MEIKAKIYVTHTTTMTTIFSSTIVDFPYREFLILIQTALTQIAQRRILASLSLLPVSEHVCERLL